MIIREVFTIPIDVNSRVSINMDNLSGDVYEHGDSMIVIHDDIDVTDRRNEQKMENSSVKKVISLMDDKKNGNVSTREKDHRLVEGIVSSKNMHDATLHHDIQEDVDAIVEYAKEPLLSLVEACAPLTDIIQNLSRYIQTALNETPRQPPDALTFDESAAIRLYTMEWNEPRASLYSMLNRTLKQSDRQSLRPYFKYLKLLLTALVKLPCAPLQTVWRGVNKDMSKNFPPGISVIWWAFSSCTTSLTVLENSIYLANAGKRTLFSVESINGRIVRAHSHFDYEDEILLLPGTYMEVQSQLSPGADLHIIHLRQIKPTKTLLELPFEGALLYPPEVKRLPWYKKKRTVAEISLLAALCLAGLIIGLVVGTRGPPICYTRRTGIKADLFWSFDCGDAREDFKGFNNGSEQNGARYSSPDFSGQGKALNLNRKLSEYVRLPHSLNLAVNTSFTVSVWIFPTGSNPATILSDCSPLNSVCIELFVYGGGNIGAEIFPSNNPSLADFLNFNGEEVNYQSSWQHLTYTFDNQTEMLSIFFNGELVTSNKSSPRSFAVNQMDGKRKTFIGFSSIPKNPAPFNGLIDQLSISYYVKNSSDILEESTLLCYYTFEDEDVNIDSGPNNIPAKSQNVYRSFSNEQSTLLFNSTDSFFQSSGFTLLTSKIYAFTIAFWLRPVLLKSGEVNSSMAILQLSSQVQQISSENYVCFLTINIGNSTTDQPYLRIDFDQLNFYVHVDKYIVPNNTWTHFGVSFSSGNYIEIHINGIHIDYINESRFSLLLHNPRLTLTVGGSYFDELTADKFPNYESRKCFAQNPEFNFTQLYGEMDDLKLFARALTESEFAILANSANDTFPS